MFETDFFTNRPESTTAYREAITKAVEAVLTGLPTQPFAGGTPSDVAARINTALDFKGIPFENVIGRLQAVVAQSVAVWHPKTAAHLHPPVIIPALAAEVVLSALNNSMDSFDQGPAATLIEGAMVAWLCQLGGLPATASGTFTAGGTQSNYMGLLLARDYYLTTKHGWDVRRKGLPPVASKLRILCSEIAHFSVEKAAIQLGLGMDAVVKVAVDERFRMRGDDLTAQLNRLKDKGLEPFAIVATEGTTDFGSFDPLEAIAQAATDYGLWLHVDAAYGGALLLSENERGKLALISKADSVTMDFHKAFFQPISCGAFLLADEKRFDLIRVHADYLNPESHEAAGIPDLVTRSLLTTRRFDSLKLWVSLQVIGLGKFGQMVERLKVLAEYAAGQFAASSDFEILHQPEFGCLVFRYVPTDTSGANEINESIPLKVFDDGAAVIGHTVVNGEQCLKLTFNNPTVSEADVDELIEVIRVYGKRLEIGD
jgi:L-2,4-diaminobutyrate decarboxylase